MHMQRSCIRSNLRQMIDGEISKRVRARLTCAQHRQKEYGREQPTEQARKCTLKVQTGVYRYNGKGRGLDCVSRIAWLTLLMNNGLPFYV